MTKILKKKEIQNERNELSHTCVKPLSPYILFMWWCQISGWIAHNDVEFLWWHNMKNIQTLKKKDSEIEREKTHNEKKHTCIEPLREGDLDWERRGDRKWEKEETDLNWFEERIATTIARQRECPMWHLRGHQC